MFDDLTRRTFGDVFGPIQSTIGSITDSLGKFSYPKVNVIDKGNNIVIEAAIPGLSKEDIEIEINDKASELVMRYDPKVVANNENHKVYSEFPNRYCKWTRVIGALDFEKIDMEKISAHCENGLLTIMLPLKVKEEAKKEEKKRILIL